MSASNLPSSEPLPSNDLKVSITPAPPQERDPEYAPPAPVFDEQAKLRQRYLIDYRISENEAESREMPSTLKRYQPNWNLKPIIQWKFIGWFCIIFGLILHHLSMDAGMPAILAFLLSCCCIGFGILHFILKEKAADLLGEGLFPSHVSYFLLPFMIIIGAAVGAGVRYLLRVIFE